MARLTKPQIIEKLTELGTAFDPAATVPVLQALLPSDDVSRETAEIAGVTFESPNPGEVLINGQLLNSTQMATVREMFMMVSDDAPNDVASQSSGPKPSEVSVYDNGGTLHRTYSKDVHGDNFKELADQFVSHPDRTGWSVK